MNRSPARIARGGSRQEWRDKAGTGEGGGFISEKPRAAEVSRVMSSPIEQ
jgi:hypothetical protein